MTNKTHFIILDTETTGLVKPDPIEIAYIHINTSKEQFLKNSILEHPNYPEYLERFCPNKDIDSRATEVNGISMEDVKDKPNCSSFNLHDVLLGEGRRDETIIMCGSNISYDYRVLKKPENVELFDTRKLIKIAYPNIGTTALLKTCELVLDKSLEKCLINAHTALGDCYLVYYLLLEMYNNTHLPRETFPDWTKNNER